MRFHSVALAVGLALGGPPHGCEDAGRRVEPFRYLTLEEGYQPPAPGEVTLYQTNGPVGGGSIQALAEGADGSVYAGTFGDGIYAKRRGDDRWRPAEEGPTDRFLMTFAEMPDGVMFAGSIRGGIHRSDDGGRRWVAGNDGLENTQVSTIIRDPRSGTLYAGTGAGVFKSEDHGRRWAAANHGMEMTLVRSLALGSDGTVYAGTGGTGLFASRDGGATWRAMNEGLKDEAGLRENFIRVLIVGPSGALYAGSFGGGVFKTTDQGAHWIPVNDGLGNLSIRGLVIAPEAIYVGTGDGVFRSSDAGERWESISQGMPDTNVQSLLLGSNGVLYAGTGSGVMERAPGGAWRVSDRGMLFPSVRALLVDPRRGLFAGTQGSGLFRSKDAGETWVSFNDGIPSRTIRALVRDAKGAQHAATPDGIYRADWDLSRWVSESEGLHGVPAALMAGPDRLYAATSMGLFERAMGAETWSRAVLGDEARAVQALAADTAGTAYAASDAGIVRRTAERWEPIRARPTDGPLIGLAAGRSLYAWTPAAVFRLVDDAGNPRWDDVGAGLPKGAQIASVAVESSGSRDILFVATTGGLWWSGEAGARWRSARGRLSDVPFHTVLADGSGLVVAGSDEHGVFVGVNVASRTNKALGVF